MFPKKKKSSETEEQLQQDKHLIAKIQPQGGITFGDEKLIKTGDGYQIQYSLKKNMKGKKTVTVKGSANVKKTIKKLKKNKRYYVRVRAFKTINGVKQYSAWSAKKNIKTK